MLLINYYRFRIYIHTFLLSTEEVVYRMGKLLLKLAGAKAFKADSLEEIFFSGMIDNDQAVNTQLPRRQRHHFLFQELVHGCDAIWFRKKLCTYLELAVKT